MLRFNQLKANRENSSLILIIFKWSWWPNVMVKFRFAKKKIGVWFEKKSAEYIRLFSF